MNHDEFCQALAAQEFSNLSLAWLDGFDQAIETFRSWAKEFGGDDPSISQFINQVADQVAMTKPTLEQIREGEAAEMRH